MLGCMTLARTRPGWENEHLATYLLSRIAFVARPMTVSDDFGTDLFCTLFDLTGASLTPRGSIAVQVKSSREPVDMTPKIDFLQNLELPYYIGVVNRKEMTLALFSGRYLPNMLAYRGRPQRLWLDLVDTVHGEYRSGTDETGYRVRCPLVTVLRAEEDADRQRVGVDALQRDARESLAGVVSRLNGEFIFKVPGGVEIFAGPASATVFWENFLRRLAEVLYNVGWLLKNGSRISTSDVNAVLTIYGTASGMGKELPEYVRLAHDKLAEVLRAKSEP
jgi:hypothetical protein